MSPPLHKLCPSFSAGSDLHLLNSLRIVPETCYSRRRNRRCVYSHLKPDRPFFDSDPTSPWLSYRTVRSSGYCGHRAVYRIERILHKGASTHHKFLLPKPCPTQLRPLARSPSHHHQVLITIFSLSNRLVAALSLSSGPYSPIPSPPLGHVAVPATRGSSDTFAQQSNTARWSARSTEPPRANLSCQGHHGTFSGRVFHIRLPSVSLRIRVLMQRGLSALLPPQHVPIVIVGTKSDLTEERQVQREALMQLSAMWGTSSSPTLA